jgi:hypothetical protein
MPRIFGQEVSGKTLWIVLGVIAAGVAVVVYVRSRGGTAAPEGAALPAPADFGGGGGGYAVPAPSSGAADSYNAELQNVQLEAAKFGLEQQKQEAAEQKRQFDLADELTAAYNQMQAALFGQQTQVGAAQAAYAEEQYRTAQAAQEVVTRSVKGKKKVECPVGEHLVVLADGTPACQAKGGGGFNFSTIFSGIGQIATGLFQGAAAAAPGIGYGAANAYAAPYTGGPRRPYTPPIAPSYQGQVMTL